ncbi:DUF6527 family protein [Amycolatopsis coloradensis]|uniref:DUF6527 family protein n=1 Tax=Amycolatopsis coloradensis TaxID=76021 RepID=A0ACD5BP81_9PSEU
MRTTITHKFVETVPDHVEDGIVYVSLTYATAVHRCCCGCGHEVVTPLHPKQWSITFNGEAISLSPSIGNWSFACRSHYWIRAGHIHTARTYTRAEITHLRADDQVLLDQHYAHRPQRPPDDPTESSPKWRGGIKAWFQRLRRP